MSPRLVSKKRKSEKETEGTEMSGPLPRRGECSYSCIYGVKQKHKGRNKVTDSDSDCSPDHHERIQLRHNHGAIFI